MYLPACHFRSTLVSGMNFYHLSLLSVIALRKVVLFASLPLPTSTRFMPPCVCMISFCYRQPGRIGTEEVNWDAGLEPGETFCLCVSPGSSTVSRITCVTIHPGWRYEEVFFGFYEVLLEKRLQKRQRFIEILTTISEIKIHYAACATTLRFTV